MNTFTNQVVLITGAGSGIGRQLALTFAAEGAVIAAIDRQLDGLAKLQADLVGKRIAATVADVTDREGLKQAVASLTRQLGPIDVLIANAGIGLPTSALQFQAADIQAQVDVNLIGVANSIEAVLPGMLERRQGHLVAISSLASLRGLPGMAGYCASKAGLNAMLDAVRVELRDHGIAVTTVCPGFIRTPLTSHLEGRFPMLEADDAARRIVEVVRRKRRFCAFPRVPAFRARLLRWLPLAWGDWLAAKYLQRHMD